MTECKHHMIRTSNMCVIVQQLHSSSIGSMTSERTSVDNEPKRPANCLVYGMSRAVSGSYVLYGVELRVWCIYVGICAWNLRDVWWELCVCVGARGNVHTTKIQQIKKIAQKMKKLHKIEKHLDVIPQYALESKLFLSKHSSAQQTSSAATDGKVTEEVSLKQTLSHRLSLGCPSRTKASSA